MQASKLAGKHAIVITANECRETNCWLQLSPGASSYVEYSPNRQTETRRCRQFRGTECYPYRLAASSLSHHLKINQYSCSQAIYRTEKSRTSDYLSPSIFSPSAPYSISAAQKREGRENHLSLSVCVSVCSPVLNLTSKNKEREKERKMRLVLEYSALFCNSWHQSQNMCTDGRRWDTSVIDAQTGPPLFLQLYSEEKTFFSYI